MADPNMVISDLKQLVCQKHGLETDGHKLYMTDWMEEPHRVIAKENYTLFEASFSREEAFCLRDNESPIASELLHFEILITETGSPETLGNSKDCFFVKTQENRTLLEFK